MPSKTTIDLIRPSGFGRARVIESRPAWLELPRTLLPLPDVGMWHEYM